MNALEGRAIAIRAEARQHKRLAAWHRQQAQESMERLREFCRVHGLPIEVVAGGRDNDDS